MGGNKLFGYNSDGHVSWDENKQYSYTVGKLFGFNSDGPEAGPWYAVSHDAPSDKDYLIADGIPAGCNNIETWFATEEEAQNAIDAYNGKFIVDLKVHDWRKDHGYAHSDGHQWSVRTSNFDFVANDGTLDGSSNHNNRLYYKTRREMRDAVRLFKKNNPHIKVTGGLH